jgi:Protein of unknown function (DUF3305)
VAASAYSYGGHGDDRMNRIATIKVGVVAVRERTGHPWEEFAWRPIEVVFPAPAGERGMLIRQSDDSTYYFLGTADIELHPREAGGYLDNLAGGAPSLYVVLRRASHLEPPLVLHLVTASPTDVQAYGEGGDEILGPVAMPDAIVELVGRFVAENHKEETFVKRVRANYSAREEHQFGQEPIHELRSRMRGDGNGGRP